MSDDTPTVDKSQTAPWQASLVWGLAGLAVGVLLWVVSQKVPYEPKRPSRPALW